MPANAACFDSHLHELVAKDHILYKIEQNWNPVAIVGFKILLAEATLKSLRLDNYAPNIDDGDLTTLDIMRTSMRSQYEIRAHKVFFQLESMDITLSFMRKYATQESTHLPIPPNLKHLTIRGYAGRKVYLERYADGAAPSLQSLNIVNMSAACDVLLDIVT